MTSSSKLGGWAVHKFFTKSSPEPLKEKHFEARPATAPARARHLNPENNVNFHAIGTWQIPAFGELAISIALRKLYAMLHTNIEYSLWKAG
jgi:hypothetical protein